MWWVSQSALAPGCLSHHRNGLSAEHACVVCVQVEICPRCGESHRPLSSPGMPASLRGGHGVWTAPQHLCVYPAGPGPRLQLTCRAGRHFVQTSCCSCLPWNPSIKNGLNPFIATGAKQQLVMSTPLVPSSHLGQWSNYTCWIFCEWNHNM